MPATSSTGPATAHPGPPAPEGSLWRNRDFQALWISRSLATVGKEAADVAYPLLVLTTTRSATLAGTVGSAQLLAVGLASVPGGALADRRDRRSLLLGCDLARVALFAVLALLVALGHAGVPVIFAVAIASSVCLGISNPPALAAIKQLVRPDQLARATAQNQIRPLGATVVGSPLGSSLFGVARALPFVATALTFVASAAVLLLARRPMPPADRPVERRRGGTAEGFRFLARQPVLLAWVAWIMGSNMAFNHTGAFLALIAAARQRGASEDAIGVMLAVAGSGGLVGAAVATWVLHRVRPAAVFLWAAWIGPVAALLLATIPGVLPLGIVLGVVFLRGPASNALFFSYVAALVPDDMQGRVLGAVMFLSYIAQPLGILAIGAIFDLAGPGAVFATMGVVSTLAALPTLGRSVRRMPPPSAPSAP